MENTGCDAAWANDKCERTVMTRLTIFYAKWFFVFPASGIIFPECGKTSYRPVRVTFKGMKKV
jgi:hypothetical protein